MKRSALLLLPMLALLGCGSAPLTNTSGFGDVDQAKVDAINRAAALRGVQVVWINLPRKAVQVVPGS